MGTSETHRRKALAESLETLGRVERGGHRELFLRELALAYATAEARLSHGAHESDLESAWIDLLVATTGEVGEILDRAEDFRAAAKRQDEAEDRAYREAVRRKTADRWRAA